MLRALMSLTEEVFQELVRLETELWDAVDARLRAEHGLPLGRFEPMRVVDERGACRVQDIAQQLSITVGGASKLIDRIEADGLCRRTPHPGDRRSSLIELTSAGALLLANCTTTFQAELDTRLSTALSTQSLEHLRDTLARVRTTAGRPQVDIGAA